MEFNKFKKAAIKRTAQNVWPNVSKKQKLEKKVKEMQDEIEVLQQQIETDAASIKTMTGYSIEDLMERVVVDTGKLNEKGKPIKQTKWVFKYPETIVPPVEIEHDGEHTLMDNEGNVVDPTEDKDFNFDANNPNMI